MAPPTLTQLQSFKRPQLQALCKENALKANGKTEVLLSLLTQHFNLEGNTESTPPAAAVNEEEAAGEGELLLVKATTDSGKGKSTAASNNTTASETPAPTIIERVQTIYQTSPATKASNTQLQLDVTRLQESLAEANTKIQVLSSELHREIERRDEEKKELVAKLEILTNAVEAIKKEEATKAEQVEKRLQELSDRISHPRVVAATPTLSPQQQEPTSTAAVEEQEPIVEDAPPIHSLVDNPVPSPAAATRAMAPTLPPVSLALARLGKHSRDSDASDRSPISVAGSVVSSGGRKRLRVDDDDETEDEIEEEEEEEESFVQDNEEGQSFAREDEEEDEEGQTTFSSEEGDFDASVLIRDAEHDEKEYTVATKTGSSPPAPVRAPSTRDPSFFARPSLPTSTSNTVNSFTASPAPGPRKSLPNTFLPFPIVAAPPPPVVVQSPIVRPQQQPLPPKSPSASRLSIAPKSPAAQTFSFLPPTQSPAAQPQSQSQPVAQTFVAKSPARLFAPKSPTPGTPRFFAPKSPAPSKRPAFFDASNASPGPIVVSTPSATTMKPSFSFTLPPPSSVPAKSSASTSTSTSSNTFFNPRPSSAGPAGRRSVSPRKERPPPTPEAGATLWGTERSGYGSAFADQDSIERRESVDSPVRAGWR